MEGEGWGRLNNPVPREIFPGLSQEKGDKQPRKGGGGIMLYISPNPDGTGLLSSL